MAELKSSLEIKIQRFVVQYGAEQLIEWLDEFDSFGGPVKFKQFKKLQKITCQAFGITIADMKRMPISTCTDAKRVISFIAAGKINLPHIVIAREMGVRSIRSINYYIRDAEEWINDPKKNRTFVDTFNKICQKFNSE
jgi:hypothetical protein